MYDERRSHVAKAILAYLLEHPDAQDTLAGIAEWWLPEEDAPQLAGFMFINVDKAIAAGLRIRPLGDTIRDTLTWARAELADTSLKAGIDKEREQALLRKWHQSSQP